ncbi:MAG: D-alanyl-D-alanine carboxypeptidase family protein [Acaryochloridaceae cyanobacterium SU_2_1]|nr:D-alanyl-D-alanine carboxypeptidase family protein [Acaryochloridaceae cyanobacterium SU_2_1]
MYDDIPEARRQTLDKVSPAPATSSRPLWIGGGVMLGILAIGLWFTLGFLRTEPSRSKGENPAKGDPGTATVASSPSVPDTTLGHFAYDVAPENELKPITADGQIKLRVVAAQSFLAMSAAAEADGVTLLPLSGFRTIEEQDHLFFVVKAERAQGAQQRAQVSAPPGRSEHHTGYAIDIGDATQPQTHVQTEFDQTLAYQWLSQNAVRYSFELSFPKANAQGVSYEPWHWRFVGDKDSLETFYNARKK